MIHGDHITVSANGNLILDDVTVSFEAGKINMIIGPNGAGKSTLVKVLSGALKPTSGTVSYASKNVRDFSNAQLSGFRAVLSQNIHLAFPLKVWEVVMMGRYPHFVSKPGHRDEEAVEGAMQLFDIHDMRDRDYMTLSGGEKQRVQFARVLSQLWFPVEGRNRVLLLDEPLTFLDVHYQYEFMKKLESLLTQKDIVIVGVVHDLNLVARFADRVLLLHGGRVFVSGDKKDVITKANILKTFRLEPTLLENGNTGSINLFFE